MEKGLDWAVHKISKNKTAKPAGQKPPTSTTESESLYMKKTQDIAGQQGSHENSPNEARSVLDPTAQSWNLL